MSFKSILQKLDQLNEGAVNEVSDADLDAHSLAKHKSRLKREKTRMGLSMPKPDGGPRKADVPAAARRARGETPLSLQDVMESSEDNPVFQSIIRRIVASKLDLLEKYGPEKIIQAAEDIAELVGDVDEIGTSDVSSWVKQVEKRLSTQSITENEKEIDYDTLEVDGIDYRDAPEFTDAYFSDGYYTDGTPLSDADLEKLSSDGDLVLQYVNNIVYEGKMSDTIKRGAQKLLKPLLDKDREVSQQKAATERDRVLKGLRKTSQVKNKDGSRSVMKESSDYMNDLIKFAKVVRSVQTPEQLKVAQRMGQNLLQKHRDVPDTKLDKISKFLGHDTSMFNLNRQYDVEDEIYNKKKEMGLLESASDQTFQKLIKRSLQEAARRVHRGGYGTEYQGDGDDEDDDKKVKKTEPTVKRGRGRPKKAADNTGQVKNYDTQTLSNWIIGNLPKKLPKGVSSTKHKLKDWMEHVEATMLSESLGERMISEGMFKEMAYLIDEVKSGRLDIYDIISGKYEPTSKAEEIFANRLDSRFRELSKTSRLDSRQILDKIRGELEGLISEQDQVSVEPAKATAHVIKQGNQVLGQVDNPQLANTIKQAIGQGQMTLAGSNLKESVEPKNGLESILMLFPHEHKMCQDGWGMDPVFVDALADYYHQAGKIPHSIWRGPVEQLHEYVQECYAKDTMMVIGEEEHLDEVLPALGAVAGSSLAGAAGAGSVGRMAGSMLGDKIGSELEDAFISDDMDEAVDPDAVTRHSMTSLLKTLDEYAEENIDGEHSPITGDEVTTTPKPMNPLYPTGKENKMKNYDVVSDKMADKMMYEGKKQKYDKDYYDSIDAAKKDGAGSIVKRRKSAVAEESTTKRDDRAERAGRRVAKDIEYDERKKDGIHGKRRDSEDAKAERAGRRVAKDIEYDEKMHESKGAKPDFLDLDGDGNKKESMKKAAADKKAKKVDEAWDTDYETPESEKGKYKGKTIAELKKMKAALMKKEKRTKDEQGKVAELNFAIRAKQKGSGKWGKVKSEGKDVQMETWERALSGMLMESVTVNTTTGTDPDTNSVNISATGEDAAQLMALLQNAGLHAGATAGGYQQVQYQSDEDGETDDVEVTSSAGSLMPMPKGMGVSQNVDECGDVAVIEPATQDEVIGTLSTETDDDSNNLLDFIKKIMNHGAQQYGDSAPPEQDYADERMNEEDVEEGNEFSGALAKAKASGAKEFEVDGKKYPVKEEGEYWAEEVDTGEAAARKSTPKSEEEKERVFAKHRERMRELDKEQTKESLDDDEKDFKDESDDDEYDGHADEMEFQKWLKKQGKKEFDEGYEDANFAAMRSDDKIQDADAVAYHAGADTTNRDPNLNVTEEPEHGRKGDGKIADPTFAGKNRQGRVSEGEHETCNECGGMYEGDDHKCEESLNEWANSPMGQSEDEEFQTEMEFMTKAISGGLNNMKQDQTTLPSTRVRTGAESAPRGTDMSIGAELKRLAGIN